MINRYLKQNDYSYDQDDTSRFRLSAQTLVAKKVHLKSKGHGNRPNAAKAVNPNEENTLWETNGFGFDGPKQVQFTLFFYFTKCVRLRGRDEHRQVKSKQIAQLLRHSAC